MLSTVKDASIVLAGIVAFLTLWTGLLQYARGLHQARATQFVLMRRRFLEDATFRRLLDLLATGAPGIAGESVQDRRNLVGFLEEVALLVNSRLLAPDVARYMYGHYFGLIEGSAAFWEGLDRASPHWAVFREFAARLAEGDRRGLPVHRLRL